MLGDLLDNIDENRLSEILVAFVRQKLVGDSNQRRTYRLLPPYL